MPIYKTDKELVFNVEGFHASHIINSTLSIAEIMPDRLKLDKEDCLIFTIVTQSEEEERSAFISFDKKQLKEIRNVIDAYIKK